MMGGGREGERASERQCIPPSIDRSIHALVDLWRVIFTCIWVRVRVHVYAPPFFFEGAQSSITETASELS